MTRNTIYIFQAKAIQAGYYQENHVTCTERALKQRNIDNIAASSVTSHEIDTRRKELVAAERNLNRMEQKLLVLKDQVDQSRLRLKDLRSQGK